MGTLTLATAKQIQVKVKHGYTMDDFCTEYRCSKRDFIAKLHRLWKNAKSIDTLLDRIEANGKKPRKVVPPPSETALPPSPPLAPVVPKLVAAPIAAVAEQYETALLDLRARESDLSDEVMALEIEHRELSKAHRRYIADMRAQHDAIEDLRAKFETEYQKYTVTLAQAEEVAAKMRTISAERRGCASELANVRRQIDAARVVEIYVYDSGAIEVDGEYITVQDDANLADSLRGRPECLEIKDREFPVLGRLLRLVESYASATISLVCDNVALEQAFLALRPATPR